MIASHLDIINKVHAEQKPDPTSPDTMLLFVLRVLAALPVDENAGLLRKDGGENIAAYRPVGVNVSFSRICYPDGSIFKILGDAGANPLSGNTPAWVDNGVVDQSLYVKVTPGTVVPIISLYYDDDEVVAFAKQITPLLHPDSGRVGDNCARMQFSATTTKLGYTAARVKHLAELRHELGLG